MDDVTFGLLGEARRLLSQMGEEGLVTAVVLGEGLGPELEKLSSFGADRVRYVDAKDLSRFQGELFARVLLGLIQREEPHGLLMAQNAQTADLAPRLGALLETALVTYAMDLQVDAQGRLVATRPVANGYLFEHVRLEGSTLPIISFLPSVLVAPESNTEREAEIHVEPLEVSPEELQTRVIEVMEADPEHLDLEETDIIVSGGRGVGKGEVFEIVHELARALGGSVAGTRPVIDWQVLPHERQIGQTGKSVGPRLIFNCGISGANEYTAGMEKSQKVIAINTDPRARIFRFADLGVVGDLHQVLPLLIERIKEMKEPPS
mgnify:CR=1 FL=1